jgi:hypothetical protein
MSSDQKGLSLRDGIFLDEKGVGGFNFIALLKCREWLTEVINSAPIQMSGENPKKQHCDCRQRLFFAELIYDFRKFFGILKRPCNFRVCCLLPN